MLQGMPLRMWGYPRGCPWGCPWDGPKPPQAAPEAAPSGLLARDAFGCDVVNTNRGVRSLRNED